MPDQSPQNLWQPDRAPAPPPWPVPTFWTAIWRGARFLCPACGQAHAFAGFLKVRPECPNCGAPLGRFRADDAPPYFTLFIVGHLLVPIIYETEVRYHPDLWLQAAIFLPAALVLTLGLLRPVKGATLGLMLKLGMVTPADD